MAIHNLSNCLPDCGLPFNSPGTLAVSVVTVNFSLFFICFSIIEGRMLLEPQKAQLDDVCGHACQSNLHDTSRRLRSDRSKRQPLQAKTHRKKYSSQYIILFTRIQPYARIF